MNETLVGETPKVSDENLARLKQNIAQVGNSYLYTPEFKKRLIETHFLIAKLQRLHYSIHWLLDKGWQTEEQQQVFLAQLQEFPIDFNIGPEALIEDIKSSLERVCFTPSGCLDYKIVSLLARYKFPILQSVSYYGNGDEFILRHSRGDIYFFAPEDSNVSY